MKLPPWAQIMLRKLPANFCGKITINADKGGVTSIERYDRWTEDLLLSRFKETKGLLEVQEERPNGPVNEGTE